MTTLERVRAALGRLPEAEPLFADAFSSCGSRRQVRRALARLVSEGALIHPTRGVYCRPKPNRFAPTGVAADPRDIARAIADRTGEKICIHSITAANSLGLTTQMSVQYPFHTTGRTRSLRCGRSRIAFEHAPRWLVEQADTPAGLALLALHFFGQRTLRPQHIRLLHERIPSEERQKVDPEGVPPWMLRALLEALPPATEDEDEQFL